MALAFGDSFVGHTGGVGCWSRNSTDCELHCPTLRGCSSPPALTALVILYALLAVGSLLVLLRGRQTLFSFRNVFLWLQFALCFDRALTFSVNFEYPSLFVLLLVVYAIPMFLGFFTFSLLIVFLIKCLMSMQELGGMVTSVLYPAYFSVLVLYAGGCIGLTYMSAMSQESNQAFDKGTATYGTIVFGTLTFFVSVTGYKTHKMLMRFVLSEARRRQVLGVTYVIVVYCFVFFFRTLWDVLYVAGVNPLQKEMNSLIKANNKDEYLLATFGFFGFFEILPTIFLLFSLMRWVKPPTPKMASGSMGRVNDPASASLISTTRPNRHN